MKQPCAAYSLAASCVCALVCANACIGEVSPSQPADPVEPPGPSAGGQGGQDGALAAAGFVPPPGGLRRLTTRQYHNTIRDLTDVVFDTSRLESDDFSMTFRTIGGFVTTTSPAGVEAYGAAAKQIARQAFADPKSAQGLLGCVAKTSNDACVRTFISSFGRRAWRRPLTAVEVDRYVALVETVATTLQSVNAGLEHALVALLQSPNFLYLSEIGTSQATTETHRRLGPYELATRLSYLIWNTTPDEELLAAADSGELTNVAVMEEQVDRLLASPRAQELLQTFFGDHLGIRALPHVAKDVKTYPMASPALFEQMQTEIEHTLSNLAFGGGDFMELFETRTVFVNAALATTIYGVSAPKADGFVRTQLPEAGPRGGLLTFPGILTLYARTQRTSPTLRGVFIRERLLCDEVPNPPDNVSDNLPEDREDTVPQSVAEQLRAHREDPRCRGCHELIDPPGLALETFDGLGVHRTTDKGQTIAAAGELDGKPVGNARELGALLRADPRTAACLVQQLFHHALARASWPQEAPAIKALADSFAVNNHDFLSLMKALIRSEAFLTIGPGQ